MVLFPLSNEKSLIVVEENKANVKGEEYIKENFEFLSSIATKPAATQTSQGLSYMSP